VIAAISNAIMDVLNNFFSVSKFKNLNPMFWNQNISYLNKWADYGLKKEKFLGSSTVFVAFTDGWHLFKAIWLVSIIGAIISAWYTEPLFGWYTAPLLFVLWGLCFEASFRYLKK